MSSITLVPQIILWGILVFGIALVSVFWRKDKKVVFLGVCLMLFAAGIYRHQMFERPTDTQSYYKAQARKGRNSTSFLSGLRGGLAKSIDNYLSPPQSSILGATMLGENERLSYDLKEKLNRSGTRHITAISGMNIIILANMLIGLGLFLGLWRGQAFYFALITIILFIIMVGAPSSAVRAGIMGGIVLFAEKIGRLSQAQRLLVITAAIMLAFNPLLLWFDAGFQLSFLATLGIVKMFAWFREKFSGVPDILGMRNTLAMTFPAVIFTAPILAANFGQVSLVSLLTNILIIPVVSLIFSFGFLASFMAMIFEPIASLVFGPVWLFLTYISKVVEISSAFPLAVIQIESFPWYVVLMYFTALWWGIRHWKIER